MLSVQHIAESRVVATQTTKSSDYDDGRISFIRWHIAKSRSQYLFTQF